MYTWVLTAVYVHGKLLAWLRALCCTSLLGYANMVICSPISTCVKKVVCLSGHQRQMAHHINSIMSQTPANSYSLHLSSGRSKLQYARLSSYETNSCSSVSGFKAFLGDCFEYGMWKKRSSWHSLRVNDVVNSRCSQNTSLNISLDSQKMNVWLKPGVVSRLKCNVGPVSMLRRYASAGLTFGLLICCSTYEPVHAKAKEKEDDGNPSSAAFSHGKKVHTDYSVIGIPGDGRCLFRSVAHGAYLCLGKPAPDEGLQRELADELRARVADEFLKRRKETEWFVEGDFDAYVSQMRKPHVWGGEPELLMASHVLKMPITVYIYDQDSGGLISIAEYGQEYGKDSSPVKVLYHGFGHYDALQIPSKKVARSRL